MLVYSDIYRPWFVTDAYDTDALRTNAKPICVWQIMRKSTRCIWEIFFTWALAHGTVIMPDGRYHSRYVTQSRTRNESSFHLRFRICHFWHGSRTFYWAKTAHRLHQFTWSLKQLDVTFIRKVGWTWSQPTLCNWQGALVSCPDHQIPKI